MISMMKITNVKVDCYWRRYADKNEDETRMFWTHHCCMVVQAIVMVAYVVIGNRDFWTAGYKKNPRTSVIKFCTANHVSYSALIFLAIIGSGDLAANAWNLTLLSLCNTLLIFPRLFICFLLYVNGCTCPQVLNDASWHKEVHSGCANEEKVHSGSLRLQKLFLYASVGKSWQQLWSSIAFKRFDLTTHLYWICNRKSMLLFLDLQKY